MRPVPPPAVPEWTLPDRLRKARELAGYSQAELASVTGISRNSINSYEAGRTTPRKPQLLVWATACNVEYGWLTGENPGDELLAVKNLPRATKRYLANHAGAAPPVRNTA